MPQLLCGRAEAVGGLHEGGVGPLRLEEVGHVPRLEPGEIRTRLITLPGHRKDQEVDEEEEDAENHDHLKKIKQMYRMAL